MQPINIPDENHFLGSYHSNGSPPATSLEQIRQGLIQKGALGEHESLGDWFENKLAASNSPKDSIPDWDHMTAQDLKNMSPEQQKILFAHMSSNDRKKLAELMKGMSAEEKSALLDNMPPSQIQALLGQMDPATRADTMLHMTDNQRKRLVNYGVQQQVVTDLTQSNAQLLKRLKDLKETYGSGWF